MPNIKNLGPVVSDKNIFHVFPIYVYTKHVTPGMGPFLPGGQNSNKLCRGPVGDATYQLSRLKASYFPYINICKICDPRGGPFFGHRDKILTTLVEVY